MRFSPTAAFAFSMFICLARSEDHHKRVPSGFTGVRGKKSIVEDSKNGIFFEEDSDEEGRPKGESPQNSLPPVQFATGFEENELDKRAPSMGFVGMRGKKPWGMDSGFYEDDTDRMLKRAPNGFFGMRGKKDDYEYPSYEMEKRVHSGFFGMRGKKDNDPQDSLYMSEKRAPSMGFVGMRGRKSYDDAQDVFDKRAPSGFFGMRGKKQWGQFALRGKKIPYQFRGKFVGVRGKKTLFDGENFETEPNYNSDMNRLLLQLLEDDNLQRTGTFQV